MSEFPFPTVNVGGIPFVSTSFDAAAAWMVEAGVSHESHPVRLANAYNVSLVESDRLYCELIAAGGVNFPDGKSVVHAMRLLGSRGGRQVRGPSLFVRVIEDGVPRGLRHYMVGATPRTLRLLTDALRERHSGVRIVGVNAPPFAPADDAFIDDIVARIPTECDIVWVGLGTPKQDFVAAQIARRTGLLTAGVGAAFDFHAGTVVEAPPWVQRAGLEWFFRLLAEPRRLWRRYLFGNSRFIAVVAAQLVRQQRGSRALARESVRRRG